MKIIESVCFDGFSYICHQGFEKMKVVIRDKSRAEMLVRFEKMSQIASRVGGAYFAFAGLR